VLGEIPIEEYKSCLSQYSDLIICSVNVIGQKLIQVVGVNHFNHANMPGNVFSITPSLQYSIAPEV